MANLNFPSAIGGGLAGVAGGADKNIDRKIEALRFAGTIAANERANAEKNAADAAKAKAASGGDNFLSKHNDVAMRAFDEELKTSRDTIEHLRKKSLDRDPVTGAPRELTDEEKNELALAEFNLKRRNVGYHGAKALVAKGAVYPDYERGILELYSTAVNNSKADADIEDVRKALRAARKHPDVAKLDEETFRQAENAFENIYTYQKLPKTPPMERQETRIRATDEPVIASRAPVAAQYKNRNPRSPFDPNYPETVKALRGMVSTRALALEKMMKSHLVGGDQNRTMMDRLGDAEREMVRDMDETAKLAGYSVPSGFFRGAGNHFLDSFLAPMREKLKAFDVKEAEYRALRVDKPGEFVPDHKIWDYMGTTLDAPAPQPTPESILMPGGGLAPIPTRPPDPTSPDPMERSSLMPPGAIGGAGVGMTAGIPNLMSRIALTGAPLSAPSPVSGLPPAGPPAPALARAIPPSQLPPPPGVPDVRAAMPQRTRDFINAITDGAYMPTEQLQLMGDMLDGLPGIAELTQEDMAPFSTFRV